MSKYQDYFLELRKKILSVLISFSVGAVLGMVYYQNLLSTILHRFNFSGVNLVMTSPGQVFELMLCAGIFSGSLLASPFFIYQLFMFIRPALTKMEYKLTVKLLPVVIFLFFIGATFGVWLAQFLITFYSTVSVGFKVNNIWDVQKFFSFIAIMAILNGLIFQMPVILTWLIRLRIVARKTLASKRRYVYAALLIITVLIPSPPDVVSNLIIFLPLAVLFETTMLVNWNQA